MANRKGITLRQLEDRVLVTTKIAEITSVHLGKLKARVCGMSDGIHAGALSQAARLEKLEITCKKFEAFLDLLNSFSLDKPLTKPNDDELVSVCLARIQWQSLINCDGHSVNVRKGIANQVRGNP